MRIARFFFVALAIAGACIAVPAYAQPKIPKEKIPSNVPADAKRLIEQLYSTRLDERAKAVNALGEMRAESAIPFLISMLYEHEFMREKLPSRIFETRQLSPREPAEIYINVGMLSADALAKIGKPAVNPLIDALKEGIRASRCNAARALGEIKDIRAVEPLIAVYNGPGYSVPRCALQALGKIKDPRSIDTLLSALSDINTVIRATAAEVLGDINEARVVDALIAALKAQKDREVLNKVALSLAKNGSTPALNALKAAIKDADFAERCGIIALEELKFPGKMDVLLDALKNTNNQVRANAAGALEEYKESRVVEALIVATRDPDSNVRYWAINSLGKMSDPKAVNVLIEAIKDHPTEAIIALGRIKDPGAEDVLLTILKNANESDEKRSLAAGALGEIRGPKTTTILITELKDPKWKVRAGSAEALGKFNSPHANNALLSHLKHEQNPAVKAKSIRVLAENQAPGIITILGTALNNKEDFTYQWAAIESLEKSTDPRAVDVLIKASKNSEYRERDKVISALGRSKNPKALDALLMMMKDKDEAVRSKAVWAIPMNKDPRIIEAMIAALDDKPRIPNRAAQVLQYLTGEDFGTNQAQWSDWWIHNKEKFL